jgi:alpha-1,6-mannosyltransferase
VPRANASEQFRNQYDHMTFPGAVPRTFIGALVLAGLSEPVIWIDDAFDRQFIGKFDWTIENKKALIQFNSPGDTGMLECRLIVLLCEQCSQSFRQRYSYLVHPIPGQPISHHLLCFSSLAEHVCIWDEYEIPSGYPSAPLLTFTATIALSLLLPRTPPVQESLNRIRLAVFLLTFTAVVFRSEVAVLLFCHVVHITMKLFARFGHLAHAITLLKSTIIPAGIFGLFIGLCMTILIDTFFWQSPTYLWPEFSAFLSNIFPSDKNLGASAWGIQPWHWYFTSALPRLLMIPFIYLPLWLIAMSTSATSEPAIDLLIPNLAYIALYSLLPHKETRFIFPVIPPLTLVAALSTSYMWKHRNRAVFYRLLSIIIVLSVLLSALVAHAALLPLSALSYPGAHALSALHDYASVHSLGTSVHDTNNTILVHLDNLSTQTGITRLLQHSPSTKPGDPHWIYDKTENATDLLNPFWWTQFDYTVMESPQLAIGSWNVVSTIYALGSIRILRPEEKRDDNYLATAERRVSPWDLGLASVAMEMYGPFGRWVIVTTGNILREGYGVQWMLGKKWSWTRGWWVDVDWVPRLYVLKQRQSLAREDSEQMSSHDSKPR